MGIMVKALAIFLRSANSTFAPSGWFMHAWSHILQVIATKSIHIIQELMNLLHGKKFSPWEDFFVNPFGSDVISPNPLCKCTCTYRCWSKHMRWNNEVD